MGSGESGCSRCGVKAVAGFRYSGERLCGRCFAGLFERRVKRVVRSGRLLGRRRVLAVGVSGRRDSMVLLFLLKRLFFSHPNSRLIAFTLDDGCEGRVRLAGVLCGRLGVEHMVYAGGRKDAVAILSRYAKEAGADTLALGVSLEDELLNALEGIMRGDVESALSLDSCMGVRIVRPLRESPGVEIGLYARLNGIRYLKASKTESRFRASLGRMLGSLDLMQPGCRFSLLKSVDEFRNAAASGHEGGR
jgi:tRNA(Ile)-lysidine synthase TilS/MesJ